MTTNLNTALSAIISDMKEETDLLHTAWYVTPESITRTLAYLSDQTTAALRVAVDTMRADGATWAQVGEALGVSAQAAHKRFS